MQGGLQGVGRGVDDVDSAGDEGGDDEFGSGASWVVVATAAGVPSHVVHFVAHVERQTVHDLAEVGALGVDHDRGEIIGTTAAATGDARDVDDGFPRAFRHGFLRAHDAFEGGGRRRGAH